MQNPKRNAAEFLRFYGESEVEDHGIRGDERGSEGDQARKRRRPSAEAEGTSAEAKETERGSGGDQMPTPSRPSADVEAAARWRRARARACESDQCASQYAQAGGLSALFDCGTRRIPHRLPSLQAFERASMPPGRVATRVLCRTPKPSRALAESELALTEADASATEAEGSAAEAEESAEKSEKFNSRI